MSSCRICGSDPDSLLAYSTPVIVKIRDWRLGCLKYFLMLLIMTYIFVYQLLYQTTYLEKEDPTGVIRFSIQQPTEDVITKKPGCDPLDTGCVSNFRSLKDLDYCSQSGLPRPYKQYPCRFWGSAEDATVFQSSALFATRVKEYKQKNTCDRTQMRCNNLWNNTVPDETYFVADVESYTILFDHTAFAVNLNVTGGSRSAKGTIKTTNKKLCAVTPNSKDDPTDSRYCLIEPNQTSTSLDIINLGVLLGAGGSSLEDPSEINNGHTVRYNGAGTSLLSPSPPTHIHCLTDIFNTYM